MKTLLRLKDRQKAEGILAIIAANERNQKYNLVDFQLNTPFSLSEKCRDKGVVKPYVYLCFPELRRFVGKPNYEMLVMRRDG